MSALSPGSTVSRVCKPMPECLWLSIATVCKRLLGATLFVAASCGAALCAQPETWRLRNGL
jgi:hypothetical protein